MVGWVGDGYCCVGVLMRLCDVHRSFRNCEMSWPKLHARQSTRRESVSQRRGPFVMSNIAGLIVFHNMTSYLHTVRL